MKELTKKKTTRPCGLPGQINSINSFLNYLDTDYRNSLYNHGILHYSKGNLVKS
jgi:hypothetical protein